MKFTEATERYLRYYQVTKSNGTYRFNKTKARVLLVYFEDRDCSSIDETAILNLIIFLREKNPQIENATVNKYIGVLRRIIKHSTKHEVEFDKLPEETKLVKTIPPNTIDKIFKYLKDSDHPESDRNLLMYSLLLDTGLRISELLSLKVGNFNLENNTITVTETKTKVHRYVFYTNFTANIFNMFILKNKIRGHIFIKLDSRKPINVDTVQKISQRIQKTLKIKQSISPHKWRHTFATRFAERNGNMEVLRIILGHSNLTTTQRYLHVGSDKLRNEYIRVIQRP